MLAHVMDAPPLDPDERVMEDTLDMVADTFEAVFKLKGAHDVTAKLLRDAYASRLTGPARDRMQRAIGYAAAIIFGNARNDIISAFYADERISVTSKWYSIGYAQAIAGWSNIAPRILKSMVCALKRTNNLVLLGAVSDINLDLAPDAATCILELEGACEVLRWHAIWVLARVLLVSCPASCDAAIEACLRKYAPFGREHQYTVRDVIATVSPYSVHECRRFSDDVIHGHATRALIRGEDGISLSVSPRRGLLLRVVPARHTLTGDAWRFCVSLDESMISLMHWRMRFPPGLEVDEVRARVTDPTTFWISFQRVSQEVFETGDVHIAFNPSKIEVAVKFHRPLVEHIGAGDTLQVDEFEMTYNKRRLISELSRITVSNLPAYAPDVRMHERRLLSQGLGVKTFVYPCADRQLTVEKWGVGLSPGAANSFLFEVEEDLDMRLCVCAPHLYHHVLLDAMEGTLGFIHKEGLEYVSFQAILDEVRDPDARIHRWKSPPRVVRLIATVIQVLWMMRQAGIVHGFITRDTLKVILKPDALVGCCFIENFLLNAYITHIPATPDTILPDLLHPHTRRMHAQTGVYDPSHLDDQYAVAHLLDEYMRCAVDPHPNQRLREVLVEFREELGLVTSDAGMSARSPSWTDSLLTLALGAAEARGLTPEPPDTSKHARPSPGTDT